MDPKKSMSSVVEYSGQTYGIIFTIGVILWGKKKVSKGKVFRTCWIRGGLSWQTLQRRWHSYSDFIVSNYLIYSLLFLEAGSRQLGHPFSCCSLSCRPWLHGIPPDFFAGRSVISLATTLDECESNSPKSASTIPLMYSLHQHFAHLLPEEKRQRMDRKELEEHGCRFCSPPQPPIYQHREGNLLQRGAI